MIFTSSRFGVTYCTTTLLTVSIMCAGCTSSQVNKAQTPQSKSVKQRLPSSVQSPRLRLINQGPTALTQLAVLFPEDQIPFGNIPAGATTAYKSVPHGVYGYTAYSLVVKGKKTIVPVMDWVGENPMSGKAFTYTIKLAPKQGRIVELVKVTKDK